MRLALTSLRVRALTSLRVRLGLLLLIVLIPTLALQGVVFILDRRQAAAEASDEALGLARVIAAEMDRDVDQTRQLLQVLAQAPEVQRLDAAACSRTAQVLMSPVFTNLGAATRSGRVFCSALPSQGFVSIADRAYFIRAMETRAFAIGDYQVGRITGRPGINLGYPIRDRSGAVVGVAFAALDLTRFNEIAARAQLQSGSTLTVIDPQGTILARYPDPQAWIGNRFPESALFRAMQRTGTEGVTQVRGLDGVARLYGFAALPSVAGGARVYAAVGIPTRVAFAAANKGFVVSVVGLAVVGLATLAVLVVSGEALVVRPFRSLIAATERLGAGDLSARARLQHPVEELEQVTRSFDRMAEALEQREAARRQAEDQVTRQLETLTVVYGGAQRLTRSLDPKELAHDIVRTFVALFGARLAYLGRAEPDGRIRLMAVQPERPAGQPPGSTPMRWDETPEGQGGAGRAIRSGFPVVVEDPVSDPHMAPWRARLTELGIAALAAFPLRTRDHTFGVIGVLSDQREFFTPERVELLQAYANQAAAALENARLFEESERRIARLAALRAIDQAITGTLDIKVSLAVLLEQVTKHLEADAADVLLLDPQAQTLTYAAGRGFRTPAISRSSLRLGEGAPGLAAMERKMISLPDPGKADAEFMRRTLHSSEGFVGYHCVPLIAKARVNGVLEVFHRAALEPDEDWLEFLQALAGQAAIAVDNASLFDGLQRANVDLTLAYDTTLEGWSRALDLRDKETEGHTQRVAELTLRLARQMGMSEEELVHVRRGALLHDIGKMGIPDSILLKPGPLTDEEWEVMRRHPVYAHQLLSPIGYLRPALPIPYAHHEKWDGSGYPRGLRGEEIRLEARIFAVVDVYDALTSDRPYRPAWPKEKALQYIREQAGSHFDPQVVQAFLTMI